MNNNQAVYDNIEKRAKEIAINIIKNAQEDLQREDAIIADEVDANGKVTSLVKVPYKSEIVVENDKISIVPTFDNKIDEFSNSEVLVKFGFEGNMTLTKLKNKIEYENRS